MKQILFSISEHKWYHFCFNFILFVKVKIKNGTGAITAAKNEVLIEL